MEEALFYLKQVQTEKMSKDDYNIMNKVVL